MYACKLNYKEWMQKNPPKSIVCTLPTLLLGTDFLLSIKGSAFFPHAIIVNYQVRITAEI